MRTGGSPILGNPHITKHALTCCNLKQDVLLHKVVGQGSPSFKLDNQAEWSGQI